MNDELTQLEIETLIDMQKGLKFQYPDIRFPDLIKKGYVYLENERTIRLTEKGRNYK